MPHPWTKRLCAFLMVAAAAAATPASAVEVFVSLDPCRVFDTRSTDPPSVDNTNFVVNPTPPPPAIAQDVRTVLIAGNAACSVPVGATAVAGNVIVVTPTAAGFLTVFPEDANFQGASLLNFPVYDPSNNPVDPEFATDNGAILVLDDDGEIGLAWDTTPTTPPGTHTAHIVIDVTGYFVELEAGSGLVTSGNGLAIDSTGCDDGEALTSDGAGGWTCESALGGGGAGFDKTDVYVNSQGGASPGAGVYTRTASCSDANDIAMSGFCHTTGTDTSYIISQELTNFGTTGAAASFKCDFDLQGDNGNGQARIVCIDVP